MEQSFWQARWRERKLGFHQADGNATLRRHWAEFLGWLRPATSASPVASQAAASQGQRVLVPLCGKTPDLAWLAGQGHEVVGVEFVESAVQEFFATHGGEPDRQSDGPTTRYQQQSVSVLVGDFFSLSPAEVGPVDVVYDRAALVAVEPERRREYIEQLARLMRPGSGLFLLSFEHDTGSGPPFSIDDTTELLSPRFVCERRSEDDILKTEPRFRERGASRMLEVLWFCRRR